MKRGFLIILAIVYAVIVVAWIGMDKRVPHMAFDAFSSDNTSENGLSLAFAYLQRHDARRVTRLTKPIAQRVVPANGVVFRVGKFGSGFDFFDEMEEENHRKRNEKTKSYPKRALSIPILDNDEEEWVRGGGRLVLAVSHTYAGLSVHGATAKAATKVFPIWSGMPTIALPEARTLAGEAVLRAGHSLYTINDAPVMSRIPIGSGDVIAIAVPELFMNKFVAQHLDLLAALTGDRRAVFFDEYVHGEASDEGALGIMKEWNLGPFLLLLLFVFVLTLWRNGVPLGAREDDFHDTRSEAVDLVASLGALYERSMTNGEAIILYHQAFTRAVAIQSRLRGEPLQKRVNELTGYLRVPAKTESLDAESFKRSLMKINEGFGRIEKA